MKEKIIIVSLAILFIIVIFSTDISNSILGEFLEQYFEPDWSQVDKRNIVKNSIPITVLEATGKECTVSAENFDYIIEHQYFKLSEELAKELQYNKENQTLIIPCDEIPEEESKLHVWYITEEALKHSKKYKYFVTSIEK